MFRSFVLSFHRLISLNISKQLSVFIGSSNTFCQWIRYKKSHLMRCVYMHTDVPLLLASGHVNSRLMRFLSTIYEFLFLLSDPFLEEFACHSCLYIHKNGFDSRFRLHQQSKHMTCASGWLRALSCQWVWVLFVSLHQPCDELPAHLDVTGCGLSSLTCGCHVSVTPELQELLLTQQTNYC